MASEHPLHRQVRDHVVAAISSGELKPGDRVPSENALGVKFDVSRLTVQRALRELVATGLVRRVQGSGTFVNPPQHNFSLVEVRDLADEIRAQGGTPHSEVLIQRRIVGDATLAERFAAEDGLELFHAAILQMMADEPVAYEERYALPDVYPDFLSQDFESISVFRYFASRSALGDIENIVRATLPSARLAHQLRVRADEPCIAVERRNWWQGRVVTLTRITYAGERQALSSRYKPFNP